MQVYVNNREHHPLYNEDDFMIGGGSTIEANPNANSRNQMKPIFGNKSQGLLGQGSRPMTSVGFHHNPTQVDVEDMRRSTIERSSGGKLSGSGLTPTHSNGRQSNSTKTNVMNKSHMSSHTDGLSLIRGGTSQGRHAVAKQGQKMPLVRILPQGKDYTRNDDYFDNAER